jgi:hypothetical protein
MYIGVTDNDKIVFKDNKNRFFVAGQYGKAAFNDNINAPFTLTEKYEIEGETIKVQKVVYGQSLSEEELKNLKFII